MNVSISYRKLMLKQSVYCFSLYTLICIDDLEGYIYIVIYLCIYRNQTDKQNIFDANIYIKTNGINIENINKTFK